MTLPSNASLQERERLAYIEGRIEEARLLRQLIDELRKNNGNSLF